jgi:histidinol-phosphate aminotransferase
MDEKPAGEPTSPDTRYPAILPPNARPAVISTVPAHHGAIDYAELDRRQIDPAAVLDFSVNSNPFGPSPRIWPTLARVPLDRYPDREALALRRALADRLGLTPECLVVGNGTAELLWLTAQAFLEPGDGVLVIGPTFGEYARVAGLADAAVHHWTAPEATAFAVVADEVVQRLQRLQPRLAFVCNPNNPTGTLLPPETLLDWAAACRNTLLVVDEAYHAFAPGFRSVLDRAPANVLVLRSMTKDYALAGLRLGYAAGDPAVIHPLARARPAWNVNALALVAGLVALEDEEHLRSSLAALRQARESFIAGLTTVGLVPLPSAVHYFLLRVGDGAALRRALLDRYVLVRDCASFGLPAYVRIATRRAEDNACLLEALVPAHARMVHTAAESDLQRGTSS